MRIRPSHDHEAQHVHGFYEDLNPAQQSDILRSDKLPEKACRNAWPSSR
jgi:hypothetical protein